jgi:hypothetical protein
MEKRSKHPVDVAKWIEKIFDSCTNINQLLAAEKLLTSFSKIYKHDKICRRHLNVVSEINWKRLN